MVRKTVAINEDLIKDLDIFVRKEQRDFSSALRYTLRIGLLALENPELTGQEIRDIVASKDDHQKRNMSDLNSNDL